ncbi:redox-regulated ATPase YchF [Candidatus Wolfebacteria bacterium]|nr:redox-regulated ATPase YchF [Candidatus Wolfebacteria bacterium]
MKLSIGIVGLPNVGKSTLFKILTKQEVNIANYPFATIDPNVGVVVVPDERLDKLAKLSASKKIVPAVVEFYDIAGLVKGAYKGEGLGNQFLSHIREVSAIVQVVRGFQSAEIIHVEQGVDPIRDIDTINMELVMKDLDTVEKRLGKLEGEARTGDKQKIKDLEIAKKAQEILNSGKLLNSAGADFINEPIIKEMTLLTIKPQIFLLNGNSADVNDEVKNKIRELGADYIIVDLNKTENINELIKKSYEILGLISFLTTGEDETRAWTIKKGAKAPEAAGAIHTDFEKKFIRAEAINWQKLLEAGSWTSAKQKGFIRTEGKEYVVEDGDVIVVRHS